MTEHEFILTSLFNCRRVDLYVDSKPFNRTQLELFEKICERRRQGEPLQYILGSCEFYGLEFKVDPRVLIPRPETEILVEKIIEKTASQRHNTLKIIDIGTGSGNIAVSLARHIPSCHITAVDISAEALEVALTNAQKHEVEDKITFLKSDIFHAFMKPLSEKQKFDLIVSNPPYIPAEDIDKLPADVQNEPKLALNGGVDGMDFYRRIIVQSVFFLKAGGSIFFEIAYNQQKKIEHFLRETKCFQNIQCVKDYSQKNRILMAELKSWKN